MGMRNMLLGLVLVGGLGSASADPTQIVPEGPTEYRPAETTDHGPAWKRQSDSGTFIDVGTGVMSAARDGMLYRAEYLRFAPQISINRWLYAGAGFQIGDIYKSTGKLDGMLPVICSPGPSMGDCIPVPNQAIEESSGTLTEGQLLIGIRDRIGIVSGGLELAPTLRRTTASTNHLNESFVTDSTTLELHARVDVWATPHVNVGIMVGANTTSRHDLMAGLQIGLHFEAYDGMNR
jgi:hypothetical protein